MAILVVRRRLIFIVVCTLVLVLTFIHLAGFTTWQGVYPIPGLATSSGQKYAPAFKWADIPLQHPIPSLTPLPSGPAPSIPQIQHDFTKVEETDTQHDTRIERLNAVKEAFEHTWKGYKAYAWGHDEVKPLTAQPNDPFGGWGATMVDSLDTMWIMGLTSDFEEAVNALSRIDFSKSANPDINIFETTIRYLGGFLSANDLTNGKYPLLLDKAIEVGDMLYHAFDTPNHMPHTRWKLQEYVTGVNRPASDNAVIAEIGTLSMEFTRLSQVTSDPKYFDLVQRITEALYEQQNSTVLPGMWPISVNPRTGDLHSDNAFTLGAMSDSAYEYLPKEYLLLAGRDDNLRIMFHGAAEAIKKYLLFEPLIPPPPSQSEFSVMRKNPLLSGSVRAFSSGETVELEPRQEHLTCFAGGMFGLGARALASSRSAAQTAEDLEVARRLTQGCVWAYAVAPAGIGPEDWRTYPCRKGRDAVTGGEEPDWKDQRGNCTWTREKWMEHVVNIPKKDPAKWENFVKDHNLPEGFTEVSQKKYILRPEAIESVFIMYRLTGDPSWREYAWQMFSHIVSHCRTDTAFAPVQNVMKGGDGPLAQYDSMESFWTGETLKYFYLIFADEDVVSLDEYVFNTEAHPFRWRKAQSFSS